LLTYRTGATGAPSAARNMSEHLLQQTLPPEMAAMADYYEGGVTPPTVAQAAAGRYRERLGAALRADQVLLDAMLSEEIERLGEATGRVELNTVQKAEMAMRAAGAFVAADLASVEDARAAMARAGHPANMEELEAAAASAATDTDYSSAIATLRRDFHAGLAERLGVSPVRSLTPCEIAHLLNGQRADGTEIAGKKKQAATESLRVVFGLARDRVPSVTELEYVLAGRKADGTPLPEDDATRAVRRFQAAFDAPREGLSPEQRDHLLMGLTAEGKALSLRHYQARLDRAKSRIGYVDLTFSAPKSVSIAWAFAPTEGERAMIRQAHRDAIESVMADVEQNIGRARRGQGGKTGWDSGAIGWVSFDHYAARPTVAVVRQEPGGTAHTELYTLKDSSGRVPGDMQLHTHTAVFNAVLTETGHVGGLDLARLEGRIKEWGALYQAYLATNLRRHGVEMGLDARTEMARVMDVPEHVSEQFSKRTLSGSAAARAFAATQGLDWDSLDADRKVGLIKAGVQNPREAKTDDISDLVAWKRMAAEIGYSHRSVLRPDAIHPMASLGERVERAYRAALPLMAKQLGRRAVIEGADARISAAKGLIVASVGTPQDVDRVTREFRERGVEQDGKTTQLIWGTVNDSQGREKLAITTGLHEQEERTLIARAREAAADLSVVLSEIQINKAIAAFPNLDFTNEHGLAQRGVIDTLAKSGRLAVVIGVAGAGKSTLLRPLVHAWQADGRTVHGIALAWRQADDLAEANIPAENTRAVEAFLRGLAKDRIELDSRAVVVIDELSLLGTRQLNGLLEARARYNFQIVAIGDPKQMQAVEAGPVIALLQRALGESAIPELGRSVRQRDAEERETVLMFRNGQTEEALARKTANGTLRLVPGDYEEAVSAVVTLWQERRDANADRAGYSISISAPTNADAHALSLALRQRRRALGEIGDDRLTMPASDAGGAGDRTFDLNLAVGDRVRLFRRTNAVFEAGRCSNIGRNGSVLTVAGIAENGLSLRAASGKLGFVPFANLRDEGSERLLLDYGEALTTNTAQGSTVTEHIHALPAGSALVSAFGAYTSGSRHREQSFIITSEGAERAELAGRRPLGDARPIEAEDLIGNIVRNFSRQPVKEASLTLIERARDLRRGAVRALQEGAQATQARRAAGQTASSLAARLVQHRTEQKLKSKLPGWLKELRERTEALRRAMARGESLASALAALARGRSARSSYWNKPGQDGPEAPKPTPTHRRGRKL
jgi:hypothetical protein